MKYESETMAAHKKIKPGTIAHQTAVLAIAEEEPLLVCMNNLLRYAKAYQTINSDRLCSDCVLGPCWLDALKGIRGLLNGDGVIAMERDISTDSKDNGAIEEIFWVALEAAGFEEKDI